MMTDTVFILLRNINKATLVNTSLGSGLIAAIILPILHSWLLLLLPHWNISSATQQKLFSTALLHERQGEHGCSSEGLQFQLKSFLLSNFEVFALDFIFNNLDNTVFYFTHLYIKGSLCNIQFQFLHDNANLMLLKGSTNTHSAGRKDWVAPTHIFAALLSYLHQ